MSAQESEPTTSASSPPVNLAPQIDEPSQNPLGFTNQMTETTKSTQTPQIAQENEMQSLQEPIPPSPTSPSASKKSITSEGTLGTWTKGKLIAKDWEYDIATQILLDQVLSQSYYIFWAEIVHAIYGDTKTGEHLKEVVDCINDIVRNERQRLSIVEQPHEVMSTPGLEQADTQGPN